MSESTLFEHWIRGNDLLFTDFRFDSFAPVSYTHL